MKGVWVERLPAECGGVQGNSAANQKERSDVFVEESDEQRGVMKYYA